MWNSEEIEVAALAMQGVVKALGASAWLVALSVLLCDVPEVACFRDSMPHVWADFVAQLKADKSFAYLYEIVDLLCGGQQGEGGGDMDAGGPLGGGGEGCSPDRLRSVPGPGPGRMTSSPVGASASATASPSAGEGRGGVGGGLGAEGPGAVMSMMPVRCLVDSTEISVAR